MSHDFHFHPLAAVTPREIRFPVIDDRMRDKKTDREREKPVTIADLRPPLFVGMRVSFVPDTLTFSRKHSCLHSCSLGRDTHYSPLLSSSVPSSLPAGCPPPLASSIFSLLDAIRASLSAHTRAHMRFAVCAYPGRDA